MSFSLTSEFISFDVLQPSSYIYWLCVWLILPDFIEDPRNSCHLLPNPQYLKGCLVNKYCLNE